MTETKKSNRRDGCSRQAKTRSMKAFVVIFVLLLGVFHLAFVGWFAETQAFATCMGWNAELSAGILRFLGESATATGQNLTGPGVLLTIRSGCDGIQVSGTFVAAVIAFPAQWSHKLLGGAIGVAILLLVNLVRIVSLYYAAEMSSSFFGLLHETIWPIGILALSMVMWLFWAMRLPAPVAEDQ